MFEALSNLKALNAAPSRARYTGAREKGERDEEGEPARLTRAPAHRKLESQFVLGRAAGGLRLRARRPFPRRLLPLGAGVRAFPLVFLPTDFCGLAHRGGGATETEKKNL